MSYSVLDVRFFGFIAIGFCFDVLELAILALLVLSLWTAGQRMQHVLRALSEEG